MSITRADLESGRIRHLIAQANILGLHVLTEEELQTSLQTTLKTVPADRDVWLFTYGSLIWNPTFHFVERRVGTIYGLHRRFCLWTQLGRGSPDNPGLVLGLDRGGSCRGIVYRIAAAAVPTELLLVWRREMVVGSYIPRWVKVYDDRLQGDRDPISAITFAINPHHSNYAAHLPLETAVRHLATAKGQLGSAAEYLLQTIDGLAAAGIHDRSLLRLRDRVTEKMTHDP